MCLYKNKYAECTGLSTATLHKASRNILQLAEVRECRKSIAEYCSIVFSVLIITVLTAAWRW